MGVFCVFLNYKYCWSNRVFASELTIWLKPQHLSDHFALSLVRTSWSHSIETLSFSSDSNSLTRQQVPRHFFLNISVTPLKTLFHQNNLKRAGNTHEKKNKAFTECRIPEFTSKTRLQYLSQMFHSEGGLNICSNANLIAQRRHRR